MMGMWLKESGGHVKGILATLKIAERTLVNSH